MRGWDPMLARAVEQVNTQLTDEQFKTIVSDALTLKHEACAKAQLNPVLENTVQTLVQ
jgi:hypothetical protein